MFAVVHCPIEHVIQGHHNTNTASPSLPPLVLHYNSSTIMVKIQLQAFDLFPKLSDDLKISRPSSGLRTFFRLHENA